MRPARLLSALAVFALLACGASAWAAGPHGAAEAPAPVRFIALAPMSAPVIRSNRVTGRVTVRLTLEVLKPDDAAEVQALLPRIQANLLNVVQRHVGRLGGLSDPLDVELLAADLDRANAIVTGDDEALRVLIQDLVYAR